MQYNVLKRKIQSLSLTVALGLRLIYITAYVN